jgi:hypothetical protein
MDSVQYWKLCDEFSIMHAALIAVGRLPQDAEGWPESETERKFPNYIAVRTALCIAVNNRTISTNRIYRLTDSPDPVVFEFAPLDVRETVISVSELDRYFKERGRSYDVFERTGAQALLHAGNAYHSKKLDAANKAWAAVTSDPSRLVGKSPKQALEKWLTENAEELGLLNKDGKPNRTGIEEICKVANWRPEGGAARTPSSTALPISPPLTRLPAPSATPADPPRETWPADLDDEIPF